MTDKSARLALVVAAVLFSTGGAAIKTSALTGWQVACLRSAVASVVLALAWPTARRGWTLRTLIVSLFYALCMVAFVSATKLTTAANAIFLQAAAPLYIVLAAPLMLRERIGVRDFVIAGLIILGLGAFFMGAEPARLTAPNPTLGNAIAVISGLGWAGTLMGLRWIQAPGRGRADPATVIVAGNVVAALACAPLAFPLPAMTVNDIAGITWLGVVQIGLAYVFVTHGVKHVPAFEASLILLLEPALNPVWTWIMLGETPSILAIAGGLLILSATIAKSFFEARPVQPLPD